MRLWFTVSNKSYTNVSGFLPKTKERTTENACLLQVKLNATIEIRQVYRLAPIWKVLLKKTNHIASLQFMKSIGEKALEAVKY